MDPTQAGTGELDAVTARLAAALPAYEIGPILGRGAFAVVCAARHRRLGREVAIKRLSPDLLREAEARNRFAAEARLLASLDHFHVVRVYDYVEEEEVCAFVMERMHGGTLADRQTLGQVSRPWAVAVVLGALHGLEHAHQKGVLHRDIKPENLLFAEGSHVKVADFGIAKVVGAQGARLTATAAAIGTPAYMAPEQVTRSAGPLSAATDVWQTGAVLYELIAGEPPFERTGELGEVLFERATGDARPVQEVAPEVPDELAEVVMRALRRDPRERYHTAAAFAAALEPAAEHAAGAGGLAVTGVPIHRTAPRTEAITSPPAPAARPERARPPRRRRHLVAGVLALAGLLAVAVLVALLVPSGGDKGGGRKAAVASTLPLPPTGWPKTLTASYIDSVAGIAGVANRLGSGSTGYNVFYGDAAAKKDWSHDSTQPRPAAFVRDAARHGLYPYAVFYGLRALGQSARGDDAAAPQLRQTLTDPRLMRIYWQNVRAFLQQLGKADRPAAVSLDSNFWSYLEQQLAHRHQQPSTVRARVAASGVPELKGIPDNLPGIAKGWRALRDHYAPQVRLGYAFDDWAPGGIDISRDNPARSRALDAGRRAAEFYLTVAANDLDFAALTIDGDGTEEGQSPSPTYVYSTAEKNRVVDFVRQFVRVADVPLVLEGLPLGNSVSKAITEKPFHWRDSWVQWLVGDDRFSGLRKLRDAGVIGLMFGVSFGEGETCPCDAAKDGVTNGGKGRLASTSADDDGGYFRDRMQALRRAGGLALR